MTRLFQNVVRRSVVYYENTHDHAFRYSERQFQSVVCPSIADIVASDQESAFLMEHPLYRKPSGEEEYRGRVDYWIAYRNFAILMELKHAHFAYKRWKPRKIVTRFNRALTQLKDVRKAECIDLATGCKEIVEVAMETIVFFRRSKRKPKLAIGDEDFEGHFERLCKNLNCKKKPNVHCLWILNERLVDDFEYTDCFEIYPAVAFIGHVSHKPVHDV